MLDDTLREAAMGSKLNVVLGDRLSRSVLLFFAWRDDEFSSLVPENINRCRCFPPHCAAMDIRRTIFPSK